MGNDLVPWWGWLIMLVLLAVWIFLIGYMMEIVRWIAEKVLGDSLPSGRGEKKPAAERKLPEQTGRH